MTNDNAGLLPDDIADIHKMIAMFHKYLPDLEKIDTNLRMAVPAAPSITTLDKDAVYESNQTAYLTAATLFRALERMGREEMYLRSKLLSSTPASPSVDAMRLALDALKSCGTEYNEYLDFKGADGMEQFYDEEKVSLAIAALSMQPVSEADKLKPLLDIQKMNGNYDCNPYMHGMANGLILADAVLRNVEPEYLKAPDVWLDDLPKQHNPATECGLPPMDEVRDE